MSTIYGQLYTVYMPLGNSHFAFLINQVNLYIIYVLCCHKTNTQSWNFHIIYNSRPPSLVPLEIYWYQFLDITINIFTNCAPHSTLVTPQYTGHSTVHWSPHSTLITPQYTGHPTVHWSPHSTLVTPQYTGHPSVHWSPHSTLVTPQYTGHLLVQ